MIIKPGELPGIMIIKNEVYSDHRGFLMETWSRKKLHQAGVTAEFVQENHSHSIQHSLRGLHYQLQNPQGKMLRVTRGKIFDVALDLRKSSPTFGNWSAMTLSEEEPVQLYIPPGFAHGFLVLSEVADLHYMCTDYYNPAAERCIHWNDPKLAIAWPIADQGKLLLSQRDMNGCALDKAEVFE